MYLRCVGGRADLAHQRDRAVQVQRAIGARAPPLDCREDARELDPRLNLVKTRVASVRGLERFPRRLERPVEGARAEPRRGQPGEVPGLGVEG